MGLKMCSLMMEHYNVIQQCELNMSGDKDALTNSVARKFSGLQRPAFALSLYSATICANAIQILPMSSESMAESGGLGTNAS